MAQSIAAVPSERTPCVPLEDSESRATERLPQQTGRRTAVLTEQGLVPLPGQERRECRERLEIRDDDGPAVDVGDVAASASGRFDVPEPEAIVARRDARCLANADAER